MQDIQLVNAFKGLVIDGVNKANSGHPGGPMSSMDLAYLLFTETLKFDPDDPKWLGRDRFILSAGHMSMLQYVMLHGIGWLTMDDLKQFRQLHSRTPGHPENFQTPGVEATTGPLGQGCAMSVGFAVAAKHLAAALDKDLFNYRTWVLCSDGDLQEGVALAAASLAGHLQLQNLVWIYDKNFVQLSGPTRNCTGDDDEAIFTGFGWRVLTIDGHDHAAIRQAYKEAAQTADRPTLIIAKTVIGKGATTMENSYKTHGSPLPPAERVSTKLHLGVPAGQEFWLPDGAIGHFQRNFAARRSDVKAWRELQQQRLKDPAFKKSWDQHYGPISTSQLPALPWAKDKEIATRNAFGDIIEHWAEALPSLFGGSADLEPSNMTGAFAKKVTTFDHLNPKGRNLNFGVREFPMSALSNGIALHGGLIPFDATFLAFADYSRPALRLGAIQGVRVIHEFTHDSFYLGEDGPTHQPVEHVMALRAIPRLYVARPADPVETEALMREAVSAKHSTAICLTRQKVPFLPLSREEVLAQAVKGAYVVKDTPQADLIIFATGSEVGLAMAAAAKLSRFKVRIVSMPCWELFQEQSASYQEQVLAPHIRRRVSIEAGITLGWERYVGNQGLLIGIDHFGASAPAEVLADEYGFTAPKICERIQAHFSHES